jgi:hypothetical protein
VADNKTVTNQKTTFDANTNSDYTVATDEIGSRDYQEVKIVDGTKGETTPAAVGGGVEANALRVTLANDSTGLVSVDDGGGSLTVDGTVSVSGTVDTELPSAISLDDNSVTPTAPAVGAFGMAYDGANWDRVRGDSANGVLVNLGANNDITGTVTANAGTGTFTVTDDGSFTLAANSGTDIGDVTINNASGASAVNIQDGGNSITVDGTVTANAGSGTFTVAQTETSATIPATGRVTGTSITASYQNLLVMGGDAVALNVINATDKTLLISLDNGTTDSLIVPPTAMVTYDFGANHRKLDSDTIQVKHDGSAATSGYVTATVMR